MMAMGAGWRRWLRADVALTCVAVATGIAGAVLAGQFLAARAAAAEAELARRYKTEEVVVTSVDVPRGTALDAGNLALRKVPREFLPPDAVPAARAAEVLGGRAAIDIARGTPIMMAAVAGAVARARLSTVLAAGERAVTVAVDDLSSLSGNLRQGDRIDLFLGHREADDALLVPLLQQVEILAVGDSFLQEDGTGQRHYSSVTLRVSAADAPRILLAQQAGELAILLRGAADQIAGSGDIRTSRELFRRTVARPAIQRMELLTGGGGRLVPERTWLVAGARGTGGAP